MEKTTDEEIKAGNISIAKFVGGKFSKTGRTIKINNTIFEPSTLSYHKSWNRLMPVFILLNRTVAKEGGCYIGIDFYGVRSCDNEYFFKDAPEITCLWLAIVEGIKNKNK